MEGQDAWKKTQTKTFTKWCNAKILSLQDKKGCAAPSPIEDLFKDLRDGTRLIALIAAITQHVITHNRNPKSKFQRVENIEQVLKYIHSHNVSLTNIGASDIEEGSEKLTLGLIWIIILRFHISSSLDNSSARASLLRWVKERTDNYPGVCVKDFSSSWRDGCAFTSLIHSLTPSLIGEYAVAVKKNARDLLETSFLIAEEHFSIPRLLDVEDLVDVIIPDEKSVMTYVSQFQKYFQEREEEDIKRKEEEEMRRKLRALLILRRTYEELQERERTRKNELSLLTAQFEEAKRRMDVLYAEIKERESERDSDLVLLEAVADDLNIRLDTAPSSTPSISAVGLFDSTGLIDSLRRWNISVPSCSLPFSLLPLFSSVSQEDSLIGKINILSAILSTSAREEDMEDMEGEGEGEEKVEDALRSREVAERLLKINAAIKEAAKERIRKIREEFQEEIKKEEEIEELLSSDPEQLALSLSLPPSTPPALLKKEALLSLKKRRVSSIELSFKVFDGVTDENEILTIITQNPKHLP